MEEQSLDIRLGDIITDVLEDEYYEGRITIEEKQDLYRKLAVALNLPSLFFLKLAEGELTLKQKAQACLVFK